ncbi:hypothetical protein [Halalkalibacter oceani]|uniref:hypothetical protein n=1 Tax=Halalkalibacter oceani TaxID=1653776 RepID=UPI0033961DFD
MKSCVFGTISYDVSLELECDKDKALMEAYRRISDLNFGDKLVLYDISGRKIGAMDIHSGDVEWKLAIADNEVL